MQVPDKAQREEYYVITGNFRSKSRCLSLEHSIRSLD